jgi:hypothetical protein
MPEVRRNGSQALRFAAAELQKLAQHMDERRDASAGQAPPAPPGESKDGDKAKP